MQIRLNRHKAFSLVELMAVLLIALIMTAIAVNSYSNMKQRRTLRSGAESIRDLMTNARSLAVSRNAWHRLVIQLRDPDTNATEVGYWIDEIAPSTSNNANPATLDAHVRALVVPWQDLPEPLELLDASIKGTSYTAASAPNPYLVIRFMPNGASDAANVRLLEPSHASVAGPITSEVRLYPATAKPKIIATRP